MKEELSMDLINAVTAGTAFKEPVTTGNRFDLGRDYVERVYAGVLGKIIGVYLGRPVENWSYERISNEFGEISYYIHEQRNRQLIVTDDDISGTFTFLRALEDSGFDPEMTSEQVGQAWMNYIIEKTTILWWGGFGNSTEHTAYLQMKHGIKAPESGSAKRNGKVLSEQIGAQIFVDGWGLINPGDPEKAADFAARSARVSHDGEAVYAAQVVAAMVAAAFTESSIDSLLDIGSSVIPADSVISRLIKDVREWHANESDWRKNRERLERQYGYDKFLGPVHVVPNHGLIVLALLHGEGRFQESLKIVNTCGWDTDCNSGNVGCILGVLGGLATIGDGPDWRGPMADRLYLPSADAGRAITDAAAESWSIANIARRLAGEEAVQPKEGARFHFELPGSVQGFQLDQSPEAAGVASLSNVFGYSRRGTRTLALNYRQLAEGRIVRAYTPTFSPPETINWTTGYVLVASPTIYTGQELSIELQADSENVSPTICTPYISVYNRLDQLDMVCGPEWKVKPGERVVLSWTIPSTGGYPIAQVGIQVSSKNRADGRVFIDSVDWTGTPNVSFPPAEGKMWGRAWAKGIDRFSYVRDGYTMLAQDEGEGLLIQGTRQWTDYRVTASLVPSLVSWFGLCARVQGMRRFYSLQVCSEGQVRLTKMLNSERTLASQPFEFEMHRTYELRLEVVEDRLMAWVNGIRVFDVQDQTDPLLDGAIGLYVKEGCISASEVHVGPATAGRQP